MVCRSIQWLMPGSGFRRAKGYRSICCMSAAKLLIAGIRMNGVKLRPRPRNPSGASSLATSSSDILVPRNGLRMHRTRMNLPNALTILRIFFVPFLVAVLVEQDLRIEWHGTVWMANEFLALCIFLVAAATDLLDGYLARRWGQITTVGTLLDPIADKLLISAALVSLVQIRRVPAWMVVLIIGREFAVSGLRSIAAAEGYTIRASDLGKTKMITQVIAISMILLSIRWPSLSGFAMLWMWGVVVFGVASAIQYFRKFWRMVDYSTKHRRRQQLLRIERQRKRMLRSQAQAEKMGQAQ